MFLVSTALFWYSDRLGSSVTTYGIGQTATIKQQDCVRRPKGRKTSALRVLVYSGSWDLIPYNNEACGPPGTCLDDTLPLFQTTVLYFTASDPTRSKEQTKFWRAAKLAKIERAEFPRPHARLPHYAKLCKKKSRASPVHRQPIRIVFPALCHVCLCPVPVEEGVLQLNSPRNPITRTRPRQTAVEANTTIPSSFNTLKKWTNMDSCFQRGIPKELKHGGVGSPIRHCEGLLGPIGVHLALVGSLHPLSLGSFGV